MVLSCFHSIGSSEVPNKFNHSHNSKIQKCRLRSRHFLSIIKNQRLLDWNDLKGLIEWSRFNGNNKNWILCKSDISVKYSLNRDVLIVSNFFAKKIMYFHSGNTTKTWNCKCVVFVKHFNLACVLCSSIAINRILYNTIWGGMCCSRWQ